MTGARPRGRPPGRAGTGRSGPGRVRGGAEVRLGAQIPLGGGGRCAAGSGATRKEVACKATNKQAAAVAILLAVRRAASEEGRGAVFCAADSHVMFYLSRGAACSVCDVNMKKK
eukprot:scaffold12703_cov101-Isochrysis_galbana.AAC.6